MPTIAENISLVEQKIKKTATFWGEDPEKAKLIAVSKKQPDEKVVEALEAGHRCFGENRVQEAAGKWPAFKEKYDGVELHLIGPLQSNKAKEAVSLFDVIQSVDRPKIARVLSEEMQKAGKNIPVFVQVNVGEEDQKSGVSLNEADAFIQTCREEYKLDVQGLMCIPPAGEQPAPFFALLKRIADRNQLPKLSMGMSSDYEIGVQFGADYIRVGTAVFGERAY